MKILRQAVPPTVTTDQIWNLSGSLYWGATNLSAGAFTPILVRNLKSDANMAAALPAGAVNGDAFVVNNWGAGNYVAPVVAPYAAGDIAEYTPALGGYTRILANVGGLPVNYFRGIVKAAGAGGSYAGQANAIAQYRTGVYTFTVPTDGMLTVITGEGDIWENEEFIYDVTTAGWYSMGKFGILLRNTWFVDKSGNDDTGEGTIERPYLTVGKAVTVSTALDKIIMGHGVWAETLTLTKNLFFVSWGEGWTAIANSVQVGAVVTINGAATGMTFDGVAIANTHAAATAIALNIDNSGAGLTGEYVFINNQIHGGPVGAGTALNYVGNAAAGLKIYVGSKEVRGGIYHSVAHVNDEIIYNGTVFRGGIAAWGNLQGAAAGSLEFVGCTVKPILGTEQFNFGFAGATTANLFITSTNFNANLLLNTTSTGTVTVSGSRIYAVSVNQLNQRIRYVDGDKIRMQLRNIDANGAPGVITSYTNDGARRFLPEMAYTVNFTAVTGIALNYQINGSGAGTIVAAVGAGALGFGSTPEVVLPDVVPVGGTIVFQLLAASTQAADRVDSEVVGRVI